MSECVSYDVFERKGIKLPNLSELDEIDDPLAIAKFEALFYNCYDETTVKFSWYVLAGEKRLYRLDDGTGFEDYRLFGYVEAWDNELGFFNLNMDIYNAGGGIVEDWEPVPLSQLIK